jgi:hypothetical protein
MRTRKLLFPLSFFVIIILAWGFDTPVLAETTLKCKSQSGHDGTPVQQIGDIYYGYHIRNGSVTCDNGETATYWNCGNYILTIEKGGFSQGITVLTFKDSSKILVKHNQPSRPDPERRVQWLWDYTAEITKGSGRFEGIQGRISISGKQLIDQQKTAIQEMTIKYTLPPK